MIAQRQSHRALELLCFAILSADRRRTPAWDKSLLTDAEVSALITIHVSDHLMRFLKILALFLALLATVQAMQQPSFHTKGTLTGKPTGTPTLVISKADARRSMRSKATLNSKAFASEHFPVLHARNHAVFNLHTNDNVI
jgi:hypothetical protein